MSQQQTPKLPNPFDDVQTDQDRMVYEGGQEPGLTDAHPVVIEGTLCKINPSQKNNSDPDPFDENKIPFIVTWPFGD